MPKLYRPKLLLLEKHAVETPVGHGHDVPVQGSVMTAKSLCKGYVTIPGNPNQAGVLTTHVVARVKTESDQIPSHASSGSRHLGRNRLSWENWVWPGLSCAVVSHQQLTDHIAMSAAQTRARHGHDLFHAKEIQVSSIPHGVQFVEIV